MVAFLLENTSMTQDKTVETVSDTIVVTVDGADRSIFMSYGLLTQLAAVVGSADAVPMVAVNNELRDQFLSTLLVEREKNGTPKTKDFSVLNVEISVPAAEVLVEWGQAHLLDFFLKALKKMHAQTTKVTTALGPFSSAGSAA